LNIATSRWHQHRHALQLIDLANPEEDPMIIVRARHAGAWTAIGAAVGIALGTALGNSPIGLALGAGMGVALSVFAARPGKRNC